MVLISFCKRHLKQILFFFALFFFFLLLYLLKKNVLYSFDLQIYNTIISYKSDFLTTIFLFFSYLCCTFYLLFLICLSFLFFKNKKEAFYVFCNALLCYGLNFFLKIIIKRPRPFFTHLVVEKGYSFPSGHAMMSLAVYGFFIYLIIHSHMKKMYKIFLSISFFCLILFIGLSRIYLGVHYASDVLAGFGFSTMYLILFLSFIYRKNTK